MTFTDNMPTRLGSHLRLNRFAQGVQEVFDLACLLADGVKGTWVTRGIVVWAAKWVLAPEVITSSASDVGHCDSGAPVKVGKWSRDCRELKGLTLRAARDPKVITVVEAVSEKW